MKKLLHERLRELTDDDFKFICADGFEAHLTRKSAEHIADEIERYYKPLPRFEDGEPVTLGVTARGVNVSTDINGKEIETELTGIVIGINYDSFHGVLLEIELENGGDVLIEGYEGSEIFKRPQPKVLDADGVEIKVGDTVWNLDTGSCGKVDTIEEYFNNGEVNVFCVNEYGFRIFAEHPERLTHKEPVLDADGVPIRAGDTVYSRDGYKWAVEELSHDGIIVYVTDGNYSTAHEPKNLTHNEPDTLDKLQSDISEAALYLALTHYSGTHDKIKGWADRLKAIMERDV